MKHFVQSRNAILREAHANGEPALQSPNPSSNKLKPSPTQFSSRRQKLYKENAPPSNLNSIPLPSDQKPSPSPAAKMKSPLPPRPPSFNPLKRKLNMETVPENAVLDSGVKVIIYCSFTQFVPNLGFCLVKLWFQLPCCCFLPQHEMPGFF